MYIYMVYIQSNVAFKSGLVSIFSYMDAEIFFVISSDLLHTTS